MVDAYRLLFILYLEIGPSFRIVAHRTFRVSRGSSR
jgi:hypothetical protein